jgi:hypothetical protein
VTRKLCIISLFVFLISFCGIVAVVLIFGKQPHVPLWAQYAYGILTIASFISFVLGPASLIMSLGYRFVIRNDTYYGKHVEGNPARFLIWSELKESGQS